MSQVRQPVATLIISSISIIACIASTSTYAQSEGEWPVHSIVIKVPNGDVIHMEATSANSEKFVGSRSDKRHQLTAIRWTPRTGCQNLALGDATSSRAFSISADGSATSGAVRGVDGTSQGFLLTKKKGLQKFGSGWRQVEPVGISDDGSVVIGTFWHEAYDPHAFYWTEREGVQSLADDRIFREMGFTDTEALAVSGDGSTIVGWAADYDRQHAIAFRWTRKDGVQYIRDINGPSEGPRYMWVSKDGSVVVGTAYNGSNRAISSQAFRWTQKEGVKDLVSDCESSYPFGMSSDGSKVFGECTVDGHSHYFIWTENHGVRPAGVEDHFLGQFLVTDKAINVIQYQPVPGN